MEIVLRPRRGRPGVGDFVMRLESGGEGYASPQEVKDALGLLAGAGLYSIPPPGAHEVVNLYVEDGKLVVEWEDGS